MAVETLHKSRDSQNTTLQSAMSRCLKKKGLGAHPRTPLKNLAARRCPLYSAAAAAAAVA